MADYQSPELTKLGELARPLALSIELQGAEAPTEFKILSAGMNRAKKGDRFGVLFDDRASKLILENFADSSHDRIPIDVGHLSTNPFVGDPAAHEAAGWFTPVVRNGELFATDVQWTGDFAQKIADRKFRFFSPTFELDRDAEGMIRTIEIESDGDGEFAVRPVELIAVALTNIPALRDLEPLVASANDSAVGSNPARQTPKEKRETMDPIVAALGASDEAAALSRATELRTVETKIAELTGKRGPEAVAEIERMAKAAASAEELARKVGEYEAANKARDLDDKIGELSAAGKLTPAMVPWAKTQTIESLTAFAATAPAIGGSDVDSPVESDGVTNVTLTPEDLALCKQCEIDPKAFAAERARELANPNAPATFAVRLAD